MQTEQSNVFFRPHLSDIMPQMSPPTATPARKHISAILRRVFRSQTRLNSDMIVSPEKVIKSMVDEY